MRPAEVAEVRETHTARVVLEGDRALKVKKPVRLPFVDYSTLARRWEACRREVEVNRELAPGLYRGVRAILPGGVVGPFGRHAEALDYAVEMRRFDERATMAAAVEDGWLAEAHLDAVARRIAEFHRAASPLGGGGAETWRARVERDLDELAALALGAEVVRGARRFADGVVRRLGPELDARAQRGAHRDGHGDLRADHVVLEDPLLIVDRLEFSAQLRATDVAADLAFLALDLEARGARWAAERLVAAYGAAGGDLPERRLFAALEWQRALVRVKTTLLGGGDARPLLALAGELAWRSRVPRVLLVGGPPGAGKSTLAAAVGERASVPVLRSDVVRRELLGPGRYDAAATGQTYAELARRAGQALGAGASAVILDATFATASARRAVRALSAPCVLALCGAPPDVLAARAERRRRAGTDPSEADAAVARRLAAAFEPPDELGAVCRLDTTPPLDAVLTTLAAWLDAYGPPG
jgi:aminoglycoside phosphotransferase family enzyme/predicted kinase